MLLLFFVVILMAATYTIMLRVAQYMRVNMYESARVRFNNDKFVHELSLDGGKNWSPIKVEGK